ncbi:hypothetical protein [Macellibacteroides fermentans]|uniref:hypothetical protein n=1 Tax=Macellibacteroides fermentans TaxID=879969 RepID=UPI00406CF2B5
MKIYNLLIILFTLAFISCSDINTKLENELTKEIGVKPTIVNGKQDIKYVWKNVSLQKSKTIKNSIDKILNVLPIKDSGITSNPNEDNPVLYRYWIWETPKIKVELDYDYNEGDDYDINVAVIITNK